MRIIRHPQKGKLCQPVVALGTFDGVHLGHAKVICRAVKYARKISTHSAVITFDPHPQEIVSPQRGLRLLTTLREREALFCSLGLDAVIVINFSQRMRTLTYRKFIEIYLVGKLGVRAVFVGYDYAFGRGRTAGVGELKKLGKAFGFKVVVIPPVKVGGQIVKSARIREALSHGDFSSAVQMLGRPYRVSGKVVKGMGRGEILGFPTANLLTDARKLLPAAGVYVGFVDGKKCVVNIGSRPTFGAGKLLVEAHLLNFNGDLRGKEISVDLVSRLRDERQFSDVVSLKRQIKKDVVRARKMW
jgi:riboflavin kinase/FMN adenylyltransferase